VVTADEPAVPGYIPEQPVYVPTAYAGTTLGIAVARYNALHPHKITMHVVGENSPGSDGAMYRDLLERGWRIMGPEDVAESVEKSGWPFIVIAREEEVDALSVEGWGPVLDHELVHIIAAANVATEGQNLAELMRKSDGSFTHEARFHEVCADFYPRDENGNHHPVAVGYGAMDRMPELLRILEEVDAAALAYDPPAGYVILPITGNSLVDAACVWDRNAMAVVRDLVDQKQGLGAFDLLFPEY
jgi:hypothetical protein